MEEYGRFFKIVRKLGQLILPRYDSVDLIDHRSEDSHVVYVSHHQNMYGVISIMIWLSERVPMRLWAFYMFFSKEETFNQFVDFTLTKRFGLPKWMAKAIAWPASYIIPALAKSAKCIPVYRKSRKIVTTFKDTLSALEDNWTALIFPNVDYTSTDEEIDDIYEGFLHIEKLSKRRTQKSVKFVPILASKKRRVIYEGEPIMFDESKDFLSQRSQIAAEIRQSLNALADK